MTSSADINNTHSNSNAKDQSVSERQAVSPAGPGSVYIPVVLRSHPADSLTLFGDDDQAKEPSSLPSSETPEFDQALRPDAALLSSTDLLQTFNQLSTAVSQDGASVSVDDLSGFATRQLNALLAQPNSDSYQSYVDALRTYTQKLTDSQPKQANSLIAGIEQAYSVNNQTAVYFKTFGKDTIVSLGKAFGDDLQRLDALQQKSLENIIAISADTDLPNDPSQVLDRIRNGTFLKALDESSLSDDQKQQATANAELAQSFDALQQDELLQLKQWSKSLQGLGIIDKASTNIKDLMQAVEDEDPDTFEGLDEEASNALSRGFSLLRRELAVFNKAATKELLDQQKHLSQDERAGLAGLASDEKAPVDGSTEPNTQKIGISPEKLQQVLADTQTARSGSGYQQALAAQRGKALAERFERVVGELQKDNGLLDGGAENNAASGAIDGSIESGVENGIDGKSLGDVKPVPILQTLAESPEGGFDIDFVDADGNRKTVHTDDTVFKDVNDLIQKGVEENVATGAFDSSGLPSPTQGRSETESAVPEGESVSSLNTAFAFQALFGFFQNRLTAKETGTTELANVLKVHEYVNLARVGYGVAVDVGQAVKLVKQLNASATGVETGLAEAGKSVGSAVAETLATGADAVFGAISAGFDIYELTKAQTTREKAIIGTQLGFDTTSTVVGAGAIASGITGVVASSVEASATAAAAVATGIETAEAAATAATAAAVGSAAAALGTAFSIGGSLFAGLGIGIVGLVDTFTKIASDVDNVGRYFYSIGRTYKTGGFVKDKNTGIVRAVGTGAIDSINLNTGDVTYADQLIDASGSNVFFPEDDFKAAPIDIPKALGLGKTEFITSLPFAKTIVLPVGVPADRISYGYNLDPGITTNYYKHVKTGAIHGGLDWGVTVTGPTRKDFFDDHSNPGDQAQLGFEVAREIGNAGQPFHFDIYNGTEWAIQHVDVKYKASHAVNVTIGVHDRTLVIPTIPDAFVHKLYYNLYGSGGNYTLVLSNNAAINAYQKGGKPSTWVLSEQNLQNRATQVTDHGIHVGSAYIGFQNPDQQTVLIPTTSDGDVFKVDFDARNTFALYVNGEGFDAKNHKGNGQPREGLVQHLKSLDEGHQLRAYTRITHYHDESGHTDPLAIYSRRNGHILTPVGAADNDLLFLDRQDQTVIRLDQTLTSEPSSYPLPLFNGDSHLDGIGGKKVIVLQMTHTLPGGHKAHFIFTDSPTGFVLQRIQTDQALVDQFAKEGAASSNVLSSIENAFASPVQLAGWVTIAGDNNKESITLRSRDGWLFAPQQDADVFTPLVAHGTEQTHWVDGGAHGLHGKVYFEDRDITTIDQAQNLIAHQKASGDYDVSTLRFEEWGNKAKGTLGDFLGKNARLNTGDADHWHDNAIHQLNGSIYLTKGDHQLKLWHDQGIRLRLGGQDLYQNNNWDNWKYPQDLSFHAVKDGYYKLDILYYERHGGAILDLKVDGTDLNQAMLNGPKEAEGLAGKSTTDDAAPAHLLALDQRSGRLITTDADGHSQTVILGKKGDIGISQKVIDTQETTSGYRVTTDDGLTWLVDQSGQNNLVDVGKNWITAHQSDWQQDLTHLLAEQTSATSIAGNAKTPIIDIHGFQVDTDHARTLQIQHWNTQKADIHAKIFAQKPIYPAAKADPEGFKQALRDSYNLTVHEVLKIPDHYESADAHLKPLKAFYDPRSQQLVFANDAERSEQLSLIDTATEPGTALLYDDQKKQLISQKIPTAAQIAASFNGLTLTTNDDREDTNKYINHGKVLFEGHTAQLIRYVDDAYQITTGDGREFRLLKSGPQLIGVTDDWLQKNNQKIGDDYPTSKAVAVFDTRVVGVQATLHESEGLRAVAGWVLPGRNNGYFQTKDLPTQNNLRILGYNDVYDDIYATTFNDKTATEDIYRLTTNGPAEKMGTFGIAKIYGSGDDKTLLLSTAGSAETLQIPAVDGVANLLLATEDGAEVFNVNNDALASYQHIIINSGADAGAKGDIVNFQGVLNARSLVATLDKDNLVLVDNTTGHTLEFDHVASAAGKTADDNIVIRSLGLPDLQIDSIVHAVKVANDNHHAEVPLKHLYLNAIKNATLNPAASTDVSASAKPGNEDVDRLVQAMAAMKGSDDVDLKADNHLTDRNNNNLTDDPHSHGA
ncbi:Uncharacterised protein [BD1-7 clade bacterium]|uniref:TcdA/TcdB toxin pore forming domain-containing protein n=1 Tax=BD1-7 clade bacterium TaxID=2029982 RepID=A0A5S9QRF2_9GAMM|nr:Uncharacterised protein [BD1-7 clade bacterium]CAA0121570.1 Uncharacterised protein [BD1-7 clade bacterium]